MEKNPSADLQHQEKLLAENGRFIHLVEGQDEHGQSFFVYLLSSLEEAKQLAEAVSSKRSAQFDDYGQVLASGYGSIPPRVQLMMWLRYGFKPQAGNFKDAIKAHMHRRKFIEDLLN